MNLVQGNTVDTLQIELEFGNQMVFEPVRRERKPA